MGSWGLGAGELGAGPLGTGELKHLSAREHEARETTAWAELYTFILGGGCPSGQLPTHRPWRPLCYGMVWYGARMVWAGMTWYGACMVWHGVTRYGMALHGMVWCGTCMGRNAREVRKCGGNPETQLPEESEPLQPVIGSEHRQRGRGEGRRKPGERPSQNMLLPTYAHRRGLTCY